MLKGLATLPLFITAIQSKTNNANSTSPIVSLDYASFRGTTNTGTGLTYFLGMPFAKPPIGSLRFEPPQPPSQLPGIQNATRYGHSCYQQGIDSSHLAFQVPPFLLPGAVITSSSEDCLSINVIKPANISAKAKLPVLFHIFGGGFIGGDSGLYDGSPIVSRSIEQEEPVIYVIFNYRLNAFGFLFGKEAEKAGAGNVGLRDQRLALRWVQKYISQFGGDPDKMVLWGVSAGALSVSYQMLFDGSSGENLYAGAFMQSGSPYELPSMTADQPIYDFLVSSTGCSTLPTVCLNLIYGPRLDGRFFKSNGLDIIKDGTFRHVPFISGDVDDEGTLFSVSQSNLTTANQSLEYIHSNYFPRASQAGITKLGELYPNDPAQGSPFDTGSSNQIYPQYKRIAALQGDIFFQSTRRRFVQSAVTHGGSVWSYIFKRTKTLSPVGADHGSDVNLPGVEVDFVLTDALINFAHRLDPNAVAGQKSNLSFITWPEYGSNQTMLEFRDNRVLDIGDDTFRQEGISLIQSLPLF